MRLYMHDYAKMTLSTEPEVHKVKHYSRRKTEPQLICTENFVRVYGLSDTPANRHKNAYTNRKAYQ